MVLGRIMSDASLRHGEKAALKECHETFLHKLREKATIEPSRATFCLRTEQTLERRSSSAAAAVDEWNVIFYSGMFFSPKKQRSQANWSSFRRVSFLSVFFGSAKVVSDRVSPGGGTSSFDLTRLSLRDNTMAEARSDRVERKYHTTITIKRRANPPRCVTFKMKLIFAAAAAAARLVPRKAKLKFISRTAPS